MKITKRQLRRIIREEKAKFSEHAQQPADSHRNMMMPLQPITQLDRANESMESKWMRIAGIQEEKHELLKEDTGKAAPFGSGMEQADLEPDEKEILGHT